MCVIFVIVLKVNKRFYKYGLKHIHEFQKKEDFYFMSEMKSYPLYENRLQYKCPLNQKTFKNKIFMNFHVLNMSHDAFYLNILIDTFT